MSAGCQGMSAGVSACTREGKTRSLKNIPVPFPILCYETSFGDPRNASKKFRSNPRKKNFWVPTMSAGCPWGLAACPGRLAACQDRFWHASVPPVACQRARWGEKRDPCKICPCHFQFYDMKLHLGTLGMPPRSFGAIREKNIFWVPTMSAVVSAGCPWGCRRARWNEKRDP